MPYRLTGERDVMRPKDEPATLAAKSAVEAKGGANWRQEASRAIGLPPLDEDASDPRRVGRHLARKARAAASHPQ